MVNLTKLRRATTVMPSANNLSFAYRSHQALAPQALATATNEPSHLEQPPLVDPCSTTNVSSLGSNPGHPCPCICIDPFIESFTS
ncbi:putative formin-like protein 5 [Iris pallida]|uniref:Formin-like protein 5 n=1 Tax=Iris pallida TaxID=29817 RepID=A0AAX6FGQ4_IRIPA|nr:putative formin-like protein 5 [Iris pallida]